MDIQCLIRCSATKISPDMVSLCLIILQEEYKNIKFFNYPGIMVSGNPFESFCNFPDNGVNTFIEGFGLGG